MKRRLRVKRIIITIIIFILLVICCFILAFLTYKSNLKSVSKESVEITFEVKEGDTFSSLGESLKENKLIKSEFFYKLYIKINKPSNLQKGTYKLNQNMDVKTLVNVLNGGSTSAEVIRVTFKEGINFLDMITILNENFNIEEKEITSKLQDTVYLDKLISEYWFLTEDIKNKEIYYSLEGYLFPDTYDFNKDATLEDIFKTMLDNTEKKLEPYKNDITKNKYTIHEIMTLASIVEKEASNSNDRQGVAGVFYNRLEAGWSLGSDVTTYYGLKLSLSERDLTYDELNTYNAYNTRSSKMAGKLPVSPICMPGLESILAAINPTEHNYYYFVADKTGKTYFNKDQAGHTKTVSALKSEGLWYEY